MRSHHTKRAAVPRARRGVREQHHIGEHLPRQRVQAPQSIPVEWDAARVSRVLHVVKLQCILEALARGRAYVGQAPAFVVRQCGDVLKAYVAAGADPARACVAAAGTLGGDEEGWFREDGLSAPPADRLW